jgi:hypothetical protein
MQTFVPIEFQQTRDFSKKLNATFEFLKQNFKPLMKCLLFIGGPPLLIGSILAGSLYSDYFNFIGTIAQNQDNPGVFTEYLGSLSLWLEIAGALVFMLISGVLIISIVNNYLLEYDAKKSNAIAVDDIWNRVKSTLPMYLGTVLLFWLLMVAGYIAIVVVIAGTALISGFLAFVAGVGIVVAFTYCMIALSLLFFIRAYEKRGFFESVGRCFSLIKNKWWSTFGLVVIMGLIQSTIASVFLIPWYINFFITMMHSMDATTFQEPSFLSSLVNNVFMTFYFLVSFLLYALPLIALAFQYFNLVELKESKGLLTRIDSMGQPQNQPASDDQY